MTAPAGWYPDPRSRADHRFWDGVRWTDHVARQGVLTDDPISPPVPGDTVGALPPPPPVPPPPPPGLAPPPPGSARAPARFAAPPTDPLAIASVVSGAVWLAGLGSLVGLVLGLISRRRIRDGSQRWSGDGVATAGIGLGVAGMAAAAVLVAIAVLALLALEPGPSAADLSDFSTEELVRWDALYTAADLQERHRADTGRYTDDVDRLIDAGLVVPDESSLAIVGADADTFCMELVDPEGTWHLDHDFREAEVGPCPTG